MTQPIHGSSVQRFGILQEAVNAIEALELEQRNLSIESEARSKQRIGILREATNAIEALGLEQNSLTEADTSKAEQLAWLLPQSLKAVEDVEYFWKNWSSYSENPEPRYLQATVLLFSGRSSKLCFHPLFCPKPIEPHPYASVKSCMLAHDSSAYLGGSLVA